MKSWDERWEKYIYNFSEKITNDLDNDSQINFLKSSIILSYFFVTTVVSIIENFDVKSKDFNVEKFKKKLNKTKRKDVEKWVKLFLVDYLILLAEEHPEQSKQLKNCLKLNKEEQYKTKAFENSKETVYHTIYLLENLHLKNESRNEALVMSIEEIKNDFYNKMTKNIKKFF